MKTENKIVSFDCPEVSDIKGMVSDCNCGLVVYGLTEDKLLGGMRKRKIVVFFDQSDLDTETVIAHANRTMVGHNASLSKAILYDVHDGWMRRCKRVFKAILYQSIFGFVPNENTVYDVRNLDQKGGSKW